MVDLSPEEVRARLLNATGFGRAFSDCRELLDTLGVIQLDPLDRVGSITRSRRNLDLDTDVVPDGTFNSSTYMIFAREARDIAADCARAGRQYVLRR